MKKLLFFFVFLINGSLVLAAEQKTAAAAVEVNPAGIAAGAGVSEQKVDAQAKDAEAKIKFVKVKNETPGCKLNIIAFYYKQERYLAVLSKDDQSPQDFAETISSLDNGEEFNLPIFPPNKIRDGKTLVLLSYTFAFRSGSKTRYYPFSIDNKKLPTLITFKNPAREPDFVYMD